MICSRCDLDRPSDEFRPGHAKCRGCQAEIERLWYVRNAERKREKAAAWRKANPERVRKREAEYRATHAAELQAWQVAYYARNADARRANARAWAKANPDRNRAKVAAYAARQREQFIEHIDPRVVWEAHGGCCGICKQYVAVEAFHVDHVIPISKSGSHGYINVQPAHPRCNFSKGNRA